MKSSICIFFACIAVFFASAQVSPSPTKAKTDTSFKTKVFKLSNDFDYFAKTSDSAKIDTTGFDLNYFLSQFDSLGITESWQMQNVNTDIFVTTTSPVVNTDHYEGIVIKPKRAKVLHLDVSGSLFSSNTFSPAYVPFYLQVKNGATIFLNELEQGKKVVNIKLPTADSVAIIFVAHPPENDKAHFHIEWSIGDTAAYSYAGQAPEIVFEKMLELAPNRFVNIHNDKFGEPTTINYPNGLFATLPAERVPFNCHVTQYTGQKLETGKAADLINAEWNKKITKWLEDYKITEVKKTESGDRKLNSDTEITTYTKKDTKGKILFIVKVFKEQEGDGNEASPVFWNTGVSIY